MWDWFTPVIETATNAGTWLLDAAKDVGKGALKAAENIEMPGGGGLKTSAVSDTTLLPAAESVSKAAGPVSASAPAVAQGGSDYVNSMYGDVMNNVGSQSTDTGFTDWMKNAAEGTQNWIEKNPNTAATLATAGAGAAKSLMDYWQYREERDERERRYNPAQASSGGSNYASHYRNLSANRGGGGGLLY